MDSSDWDARYAVDELVWRAEPNRFVVEEVHDLAPGRALDLACGEGRNAVWLAQQGWRATGVDFSTVALEKAARLAASRDVEVEWIAADLTSFEPPEAAFDLVLLCYVHLVAAERAALHAGAARALAPGGTILVVGHDLANLTEGVGGPQDPAVLFTPEDVVRDLAGLEIVRAESVRRPVEGSGDAIDALVRARRPG
ncbi:MAG TPA: class I SAM-dependent methyltransferase [Acidimicrobiales bacterium]|nr:class I SAM-dependent methyltransferase [Acidimicrobiales bacterium]